MVEARRVKAAPEHVVADLQRIVVGIEPCDADFLRQRDRRLHRARIGHADRGRLVRRDTRQIGRRRRPGRRPGTEPSRNRGSRFVRRHVADDGDGRQIGTERRRVEPFDVVQRQRAH